MYSRISLIYKKGPPADAKNYRAIAVSTSLYVIVGRLILHRIKHPLHTALSSHQAGSKQGRTTSDKAASLDATVCRRVKAYVCLLDIAKAYPSTPHPTISTAPEAIGIPRKLIRLVDLTCQQSTHNYPDFHDKLSTGIKEGCCLSPSLFVMVCEAFHTTLPREFPTMELSMYLDDLPIIAPNWRTLLKVLHRVTQLSYSTGFQANPAKAQICRWSRKHKHRVIKWNAHTITVRAPIFTYLGHIIAHPQYHCQAQYLLLSHVSADIA